jgi:hypothetical protein
VSTRGVPFALGCVGRDGRIEIGEFNTPAENG